MCYSFTHCVFSSQNPVILCINRKIGINFVFTRLLMVLSHLLNLNSRLDIISTFQSSLIDDGIIILSNYKSFEG